jgi:hypothetical protein
MNVFSFTPSRIGIMTSRRSKLPSFGGSNFAGMSGSIGGVGAASARVVSTTSATRLRIARSYSARM